MSQDSKSIFEEEIGDGNGEEEQQKQEEETTQIVPDHTYNEEAEGGGTRWRSSSSPMSHASKLSSVGNADDDKSYDVSGPETAGRAHHSRGLASGSIRSAVSETTLTAASYALSELNEGDDEDHVVPPTPSFSLTSSTRYSRKSPTSHRRINFDDETDQSRKSKRDEDDKEDKMGVPSTPISQRSGGSSLLGFASFLGDWDHNNNKNNTAKTNTNKRNNSRNDTDDKKTTKKKITQRHSSNDSPSSSSSSDTSTGTHQNETQSRGMLSSSQNENSHRHNNTHSQQDEEDQTLFPEGLMLVRGTDIHIETAARAFQDFLVNFTSLEDCDTKNKKVSIDADDDDNDKNQEDPSITSELEDEFSSYTPPYYIEKLKSILLGISSTKVHDLQENNTHDDDDDDDDGLRSSSILATTAFMDLNTQHLFHYSPACQKLYYQLISSPTEVVPLMDILVGQQMEKLLKTLHEEKAQSLYPSQKYATLQPLSSPIPRTQVRPFFLKDLSYMRSLDPNAIDNLLTIRGMIVRSSPIIPDLKVAYFQCDLCAFAETVTLSNGRIQEPTVCRGCNIKDSFRLIHNRCIFADKQMVRMQETPDEVPAGETPASIVLFAFDDLVDAVRPGDRVEVTGILRAQPRRVHPRISKVKSVYKTYLDVIHFRRISGTKDRGISSSHLNIGETLGNLFEKNKQENSDDDSNLIPTTLTHEKSSTAKDEGVDGTRGKGVTIEHIGATLSKERVALLKQLASDPDIYERLVQSLAPSIWGMDDVKKGVLCMLFGGNSKRVKKGTTQRMAKRSKHSSGQSEHDEDASIANDDDKDKTKLYKRGDINILLCGDPGTSKSQLLSYVHALSPRGVYTSGKGSSAVGLTASIVRDPETRELVLESGALVLSDLGCCCIDEVNTNHRNLSELEQHTLSHFQQNFIV